VRNNFIRTARQAIGRGVSLLHDPEPWKEWIPPALTGIGLATVFTDARGHVLSMNAVAESLTGWPLKELNGLPLTTALRVENESTRQPAIDPISEVLLSGAAIGLADHTVLIARDGREWRIDQGAAAIRDAAGAIVGAVLIFCDVGERQRAIQGVEEALVFAEGIVRTVREPLVVLDMELRVKAANLSFYKTFHVTPQETEGCSLFDLGNRQWDIPRLRELLENILPRDTHFNDFKVEYKFEDIGHRSMVLNARQLHSVGARPGMILLAIEDETERVKAAESLTLSETRYRRLFETAQDGILIVDAASGLVFDANPFLTDLLGYTREELVGKQLWEIGLFRDIESNKRAFRILQERHYIRYEDLPLLTKDGRHIEVEFVSNVYNVGHQMVIQCNIRDATDRKRAEAGLREAHDQMEARVRERTAELAHANGTLRAEIARREQVEAERRSLQGQLATAQEDERRRIARELHDQMGQHLTALGLGLKVVKDVTPDPSPARDRLEKLQALTALIGREVHHLALELRPTALDDLGLKAALTNYIEGCAERSGVQMDFHATGLDSDRLTPPIETALYRVIQESLTNILKHAGARRVSVVLQRSAEQVFAVVEDDGGGFDADSGPTVNERRLGLLGMRERLVLVGGSLTIESQLGRGTTIIARVPLRDGAEEVRDA
jgi:PAS domain S-box-containing protein